METEALIAYLTSKSPIKGKKALQKLVYFCTELKVPVRANYRLYIYGPYSNEVAEELNEAVIKEIVKAGDDGLSYYKGLSCDEYLATHQQEIQAHREKIDRVLATFGSLTPLNLELYATIHFIAVSLQEAYGRVSKEKVLNEVYSVKAGKFTIEQIETAYDNLLKWGWLAGDGDGVLP
ncbi:MAG: hypothetical protein AB1556_13680 [Bacillota bacterium]